MFPLLLSVVLTSFSAPSRTQIAAQESVQDQSLDLTMQELDFFSCGPCLLQPGTRSMLVVIDHETPLSASLRYWPSDGDVERMLEHTEPARHHSFALEDLAPGTAYSYEVQSEGLSSGIHEFRTLPEQPIRYRALVMGDVRTQPDVWGKVSGRMFADEREALFVIGTGDYPSDGRKYEEWIEQFYAPARDFLGSTPLWPAIGNHEATRRHDDVTNIERSHYFSLFDLPGNERWYRVDTHLVTLLVLDTNSHLDPEHEQYQWLRRELRSARNRFTLVALHHAPLTSGPHARLQRDGTPAEWPLDEGRRFLVPLFEMYGVDLVLAGHDHLYERSQKDGVTYVVTGGGGAPLYSVNSVENPYQEMALAVHHYVTLDIDASGIEVTAIDQEGQMFDNAFVARTPAHLKRREHSLALATEAAVVFGTMDPVTHGLPVLLSNPFDQPLHVQITPKRRGASAPVLERTIPVGELLEEIWTLEEIPSELALEPWKQAITMDLALQFKGHDQAMEVDVSERRMTTVYHPIYPTRKLDEVVLDGFPSEWGTGPSMQVNEFSPIVRNEDSYRGPDDFSAQVQFAWGEGHLRFLAEVTDDALILGEVDDDIDRNDSLRLVFDTSGSSLPGPAEFSFGAGGAFESSAEAPGVRYAVSLRMVEGALDGEADSAPGWVLEVSIPLELLGLEPGDAAGQELSCDILFGDRDSAAQDAQPSYHRMWTPSRSRSDTRYFGRLQLLR